MKKREEQEKWLKDILFKLIIHSHSTYLQMCFLKCVLEGLRVRVDML